MKKIQKGSASIVYKWDLRVVWWLRSYVGHLKYEPSINPLIHGVFIKDATASGAVCEQIREDSWFTVIGSIDQQIFNSIERAVCQDVGQLYGIESLDTRIFDMHTKILRVMLIRHVPEVHSPDYDRPS